MLTTSPTGRLRRALSVRDWLWWQYPVPMRCYVAALPMMATAAMILFALRTDWQLIEAGKFLLLMCCGVISTASTPRIMYSRDVLTRDFSAIWVLPVAILLPPIYSMIIPIPLFVVMHFFVYRGILHRWVFTVSSISLTYAAASVIFHSLPAKLAGPAVGSGMHAFTWCAAVLICEVIAGRAQHFFLVGAIKLSNPSARVWKMEWNREALQGVLVELDLGILITLAVGLSPALVLVAVPSVLLVRRFLVHPILMAQSRTDSKTGLLNVSTWEKEAESERSRAVRMGNAMSVALVDIDHFKAVNDTYGHMVGDRVLKALAESLTSHMRDYDKAGRFGGEEFVLMLAQANEGEACRIAERLREQVGEMTVPVSDAAGAACVRVTISIGVTSMAAGKPRELSDMLTAADAALYRAKRTGRNRVCVARRGLDAEVEHGLASYVVHAPVESVGTDPAAASLGLAALRSAHNKIRGVLQPFAVSGYGNPVQAQRTAIDCSASR